MLQNRSLCAGFSLICADKRERTMLLPDIEISGPLRVTEPLDYVADLRFNTSVYTLEILLRISTHRNESLNVVFKPAMWAFSSVCKDIHKAVRCELLETKLPTYFCVDLHSTVSRILQEVASESPGSSHMLALARNNFLHSAKSVYVYIRLSRSILHRRLLVECLFATAFSDAHLFVYVDGDQADASPDIVVAGPDELQSASGALSARGPSRLLVISEGIDAIQPVFPLGNHVLVISSTSVPEGDQHQIYLPTASSSFINRRDQSPYALLQTIDSLSEPVHRSVIGFCACEDKNASYSAPNLAALTVALTDRGIIPTPRCEEASSHQPFHHDLDVQRCQQPKFAIVFEDHPDIPGYISHQIVSAFLAGSIPIYYGHSATASWLFNPRAFIDCRSFVSMEACALEVAQVDGSEELYASMRGEAAVVNVTAFWEVFSWHPDAFSGCSSHDVATSTNCGQIFRRALLNT